MTKDDSKDNNVDEQSLNTEQPPHLFIEDEEPTAPGWSKKDIRHNMIVMVMIITVFELGWDDFHMALQPFMAHLKMSNLMIGLVSGATIMTIPGLLVSPFISRKLRQKKVYAFAANSIYLLMIGLLGICVVFADKLNLTRESIITITIVLMLTHHFLAGFVALPVQEFVAGCIPMSFRGRYNGISHTTGSIAGLATTALGGWILATQIKPMSYGYLFLITWVVCSLSWTAALFAREKETDIKKVPLAWSKEMLSSVLQNKPFVRMSIVAFICGALFNGGGSFIQQYAYRELQLPDYNAAIFQTITLVGRLLVSFPAGFLIDRFGPKRFYPYWGIITAIGLSFPIFLQNKWGIYLFMLNQVLFMGVFMMARSILHVSLPKPEHRAGTYTISMLLGYTGMFLDKIIGGLLSDHFGYRMTFIICAIGALIATPAYIWVARSLRDDRKDLY